MGARNRRTSHKSETHHRKDNREKSSSSSSTNAAAIGNKTGANIATKQLIRQSSEKKDSSYMSNVFGPWSPQAATAFKVILSARLCAAVWSNVSDCDETYNYWEISHFLIHGKGFQTWEYSPLFAIRSYFYVWLYTLPALLYTALLQTNKLLVFYYTRCLLAFCCALCETYFYRGLLRQFGPNIARLALCFLVISSGMFISSTAFLPSTFSMYMTFLIFGSWLQQHYRVLIFTTGVSVLIGWPFSAIVCIPVAIDLLLMKKRRLYFIKWTVIFATLIAVPLIAVDSYYYGKLVIAPLNIVLYNVFSSTGANLYGTEPWHYYLLNGFLNFNLVFVGSLVAFPVMVICKLAIKSKRNIVNSSHWICLVSLYLWYLVFFMQAHKEERFLYPAYPLICLCAAFLLEMCHKAVGQMVPKLTHFYSMCILLFIFAFTFLSISRSLLLYKGYHGSMDVFMELGQVHVDHNISLSKQPINLCLGKEWHRYPNSYFLPSSEHWRLRFVKSSFGGQLPKPFDTGVEFPTRIIPDAMNDENREEPSRYVSVNECAFLIDTDYEYHSDLDYPYSKDKDNWQIIHSYPFLDKDNSPQSWRAFYLPFITEIKCKFIAYNLLRNRHFDFSSFVERK